MSRRPQSRFLRSQFGTVVYGERMFFFRLRFVFLNYIFIFVRARLAAPLIVFRLRYAVPRLRVLWHCAFSSCRRERLAL